jgi:hypothetical protein
MFRARRFEPPACARTRAATILGTMRLALSQGGRQDLGEVVVQR